MRDSITESIKITKNRHTGFLRYSDEVEKKRNIKLLSKGNTLKGKCQEEQDEASKLEETLQVLQEKRKKDYVMDSYGKTCETLFIQSNLFNRPPL